MPEIYMPFDTPDDDVAVARPPCLTSGHITFGSFNALSKINARMIAVWSKILACVPTSRLLVMTVPEGRTRAYLADAFAAHGIAAERLLFRSRVSERAFLEAHGEADIALDTFPFHGTTTTAHSLWMGLPVITLAGAVHAARVGVSMLANVGLERFVASTEAEYCARAVELAHEVTALQRLRATLRERMRIAPNMDGPRFARGLEDAYRRVWAAYCSGGQ
jgi:predicted O-linked N-acetylglucosamine transferase (SPINDLY family)